MLVWSPSKADKDLYHELSKFVRANEFGTGEYVESRLTSFRNLDKVGRMARQSSIGVTAGIASLFFARFYTSKMLIQDSGPSDVCDFMNNKRIGANYMFTATTLSILHGHGATYDSVIKAEFNDLSMASSFLSLEKELFKKLDTSKNLRDKFACHNRATEPFTLRKIEPDMLSLARLHRRVWFQIKRSIR
jgi:hypothetical protein